MAKQKASSEQINAVLVAIEAVKKANEAIEGLPFTEIMPFQEEVKALLHEASPVKTQPVDLVRWVPYERVRANNWNPNSVAKNEMKLLHTSIDHDGYTQPVVTIYDSEDDMYTVVDGFHRYTIMRNYDEVREKTDGLLPVVVLDKDANDLMASTVRHNRARGKHAVDGMADMVFKMLDNGWSDEHICNMLGMEADEILRLKVTTGFAKLYEDVEYRKAWESRKQIKNKVEYRKRVEKRRKDGPSGEPWQEAYTLERRDRLLEEELRERARSQGDESDAYLEEYKKIRDERMAREAGRL